MFFMSYVIESRKHEVFACVWGRSCWSDWCCTLVRAQKVRTHNVFHDVGSTSINNSGCCFLMAHGFMETHEKLDLLDKILKHPPQNLKVP